MLLLKLPVAPGATVDSPSAVMGSHCVPLSRDPLPVGWVGRAGAAAVLLPRMSQLPKGAALSTLPQKVHYNGASDPSTRLEV